MQELLKKISIEQAGFITSEQAAMLIPHFPGVTVIVRTGMNRFQVKLKDLEKAIEGIKRPNYLRDVFFCAKQNAGIIDFLGLTKP